MAQATGIRVFPEASAEDRGCAFEASVEGPSADAPSAVKTAIAGIIIRFILSLSL
jgi:hypothetical protein